MAELPNGLLTPGKPQEDESVWTHRVLPQNTHRSKSIRANVQPHGPRTDDKSVGAAHGPPLRPTCTQKSNQKLRNRKDEDRGGFKFKDHLLTKVLSHKKGRCLTLLQTLMGCSS